MSKVAITDTYLTNIANAIRSKSESSDTYTPSEMASAILDIPSGGTEGVYKVSSVSEMNAIDNPQENDFCIIYDNQLIGFYIYDGTTWQEIKVDGILPSEYRKVNYIEATGTQYINTGYRPYITKTEIKFAFGQNSSDGKIAGMYAPNYDRYYVAVINDSDIGANTIGIVDKNYNILYKETANTNIHTVIYNDNGNTYYDGTLVGQVPNLSTRPNSNLVLFGQGTQLGTIQKLIKGRIYYCKIWDNGVLVRDYLPCIRKSDNVVGMYDLVNNVFYTNGGTGTFLYG